jgi:amino acid adenylation domain-containing protein
MEYFTRTLGAFVADANLVVDDFDLMSEAERAQVLHDWNETAVEYPAENCIQQLFEEQAEKTPDRLAVMLGHDQVTYGELNRRANRLGHHLRELGIGPDTRVAVCLGPGVDVLVAQLAVLKAGGAYVPLNASSSAGDLTCILRDSAPALLLTQRELIGLFEGLGDNCRVIDVSDDAQWKRQPTTNLSGVATAVQDLACVMYTSASQTNGVMITHRNVVRLVCNPDYVDFRPGLTVGQISNIASDSGAYEIWGALLNGCCLMIIPRSAALTPQEIVRQLKKDGVAGWFVTTELLNECSPTQPDIFSEFSQLLVGADLHDLASVRRALKNTVPHKAVFLYGSTGTFFVSSPDTHGDTWANGVFNARPIANTRMYILDRHLATVPPGGGGELYIGGPVVAQGYLGNAVLTAERFLPDPRTNELGATMYRTGDIGRSMKNGVIQLLASKTDQVNVRGYRIDVGRIERCLTEHPSIRDAIVVAREGTPDDKYLVAYYLAEGTENKHPPKAEELRDYLRHSLPEYMLPLAYVPLQRFPLGVNGKVNRQELPAPMAPLGTGYEAPEGEIETAVAEIWSDVLGVERVGRQDNFFTLGGRSLLAAQVIARLRHALGVEVGVDVFFARPVLASLAEWIIDQQLAAFDSGDLSSALKLMEGTEENNSCHPC